MTNTSKHKDVLLGLLLAGFVGLLLFGGTRAAQVAVGDHVVVITESDVYDRPKTTSNVVGHVLPGDEGDVLQVKTKPSGTYAKVSFASFNGWVLEEVLEVAADTAPNTPANLSATAQSASTISLEWDDMATNELAYEIERCEGAGCTDYTLLVGLGADVESYSDSGLVEETSYSYRVRATNTIGASGYSNEASATTEPLPAPPDGDPTNLVATSDAPGLVSLMWDDNATNEGGYNIERCTGVGCSDFAAIVVTGADVVSYDDSTVAAETSYEYRVQAVNEAGVSTYSNTAAVTTPPSDIPTNVTIGYLGCSMTRDKGTGMSLYTDIDTWTKTAPDGTKVLKSYSGGGIVEWGTGNNIKWNAFDNGLSAWPDTNIILWEVCIREEDIAAGVNAYLDEVQFIADEIQSRTDAELYVIGQVPYDSGHVCHTIGPDGAAFSQDIADLAVANTYAQHPSGLILGPLGSHQVKADGCHSNLGGMQEQACQIEAWLEGSSPDGCQL